MDAPRNAAELALDQMIERLHARGRLRVWSLIVTVFGDAIAPRGGRVALSVLQEIMTRLAIEPGAVRTALSRLAADHWVTREKDGRNSFYRLADEGRHAFDLATRRIYAAGPPVFDGTWTVAIVLPESGSAGPETAARMAELGFAASGNAWLRPGTDADIGKDEAFSDMLVVSGRTERLTAGIDRLWKLDDIARSYRAVTGELTALASALNEAAAPPPLDAIAARILVNHHWRRAALRDPGLPAELLPADWAGEDARAMVKGIYASLMPASEAWLDRAGLPGQLSSERFSRRFGLAD